MNDNLKSLLENPAILAELDEAVTPEKISEVLGRYDIQVDPETLQEAENRIDAGEELNEDELDDVAGGFGSAFAMAMMATMIVIAVYRYRKARSGR